MCWYPSPSREMLVLSIILQREFTLMEVLFLLAFLILFVYVTLDMIYDVHISGSPLISLAIHNPTY